jgi:hypothetical protein
MRRNGRRSRAESMGQKINAPHSMVKLEFAEMHFAVAVVGAQKQFLYGWPDMINFGANADELNKLGRCFENRQEQFFRKPRVGSKRAIDWRRAAETGHERVEASPDLLIVGAYTSPKLYDECRASKQHDAAAARIARVAPPKQDPVFGFDGPLMRAWYKALSTRR